MDPTNSEARDAESVAGTPMDPDRAASPLGLDVLTMAEFVSVQDRDPGMVEDLPPSLGVSASSHPSSRERVVVDVSVVLRYAVTRKAVTRNATRKRVTLKATRKAITRKRCTRNIH